MGFLAVGVGLLMTWSMNHDLSWPEHAKDRGDDLQVIDGSTAGQRAAEELLEADGEESLKSPMTTMA